MTYAIREGDIPGVQLRCERGYPVPAETLWQWLVEPQRAERWLAGKIEPEADGHLWTSREAGDQLRVERVRTIRRDEGRLWVVAFECLEAGWESATEVRFEVGAGAESVLGIRQSGFQRLSLSRCLTDWERYRRRWRTALDRLARVVTTP